MTSHAGGFFMVKKEVKFMAQETDRKMHTSNVDSNPSSDRPQDEVMQMMDFRASMGWEPLPDYSSYRAPGLRRTQDMRVNQEVEFEA
jgi:hypothetical protein